MSRRWLAAAGLAGAGLLATIVVLSGGTVVSPGAGITNPLPVSGTVAVSNLVNPMPVSGTVSVTNFANPLPVSGTVTSTNDSLVAPAGTPPTKLAYVGGYIYPPVGGAAVARALEIDTTNSLNVVDSAHHEQHEGYGFSFTDAPTTLSSAGTRTFLVTVGTGGIHFVPRVDASLSGVWAMYEAPTCSTSGTSISVLNRRRDAQALLASTTTVGHTPACTVDGTLLEEGQVGGGGSSNRIGSQTNSRFEWILKPSTKYLVRFTADSNSTRVILGGEWYQEHNAAGAHVL